MDLSILEDFEIQTKEHWGPSDFDREEYRNLPISFFNRFERMGRCCDPTLQLLKKGEDENEFIVVEAAAKKAAKNVVVVKPKLFYALKSQQANRYATNPTGNKINYRRNKQAYKTKMKESVTVKNNWAQLNDVYKPTADDAKMAPPTITEIKEVGLYRALNPVIEKVQRREYRLEFKEEDIVPSQTIRDEVFRELIGEFVDDKSKQRVFACEKFLTALMTVKTGQYPWHIKATKEGSLIILDNYDEKTPNYLDLFTANENTQNNMPQDESKIMADCMKATQASRSFKRQLASGQTVYTCEDPGDGENYTRYVRIDLGRDLEIYTKVNIDGGKIVTDANDDLILESYLIRGLFETETNYEWKKKFQTSAGEIISQEYLANNCNWQKWLIEGELANIFNYKIGYLSETKEPGKFSILNVMEISPKDIETNISFRVADCWSIVKSVVDTLFSHEDGQYLLVKSPFQHTIKLYKVPVEEDVEEP